MATISRTFDRDLRAAFLDLDPFADSRVWLDSAVGAPGLGERSLLVLESESRAVVTCEELEHIAGTVTPAAWCGELDARFAADAAAGASGAAVPGADALGWIGYVAWEAAPLFDAAFPRTERRVPFPVVRFDAILSCIVADAAGARLICRGASVEEAGERADGWSVRLAEPRVGSGSPLRGTAGSLPSGLDPPAVPRDLPDRDAHLVTVQRAIDDIHSGRLYQACVTFPIRMREPTDWQAAWLQLRQRSPADMGAFLRMGPLVACCTSPERFLEVRDGRVTARPMKGTRRRSDTDPNGARELSASSKDRAENVMIVDLLRNDLGRVCEIGSVEVPELFTIETYRTVHQMTSTVRGRLREGVGPFELLRAAFPPGSMSGAPKVEAARLIRELEPEPRGLYAGCIGWLGFSGRWSFNVVIRTLQRWGNGEARWNVGGGIVADSVPAAEWDEALAKAAAVILPRDY